MFVVCWVEKELQLWHPHNWIYHIWVFFVLNDLVTKVQNHFTQSMKCILCHPVALSFSSSNTMQPRKNTLSYNPTHGITSMKKHVDNEHGVIMNQYK
jgi:hypothetical protein